ncbi:MAG: hypothetical protein ABL886_01185 [Rhodoglobus sp.]
MRWAILGVAVLLLAGCAPAAASLPDGVTVAVYQGRFDRAERQLELKVTNGTDATITVTAAELDSTRFATPALWDRPQDIPSGSARDLRVQLGAPACGDTVARDEVVLHFTLADGTSGTSRLAIDDVSAIDTISAEDCLAEAVGAIATIRVSKFLAWQPDAHAAASLDITVTPTGSAGTLSVTESSATVLLSLIDSTGAPVFTQPESVVVSAGSAPGVIRLQVIPARCDPHAVAEDKRGTIFPLRVHTSDGLAGQIAVPVSDAVRSELYAYYGDYCGLP